MLIGIIADKINCDWYKSLFYNNNNNNDINMSGLYIAGILSIIKYTLGINFMSILDGYVTHKWLKNIQSIIFLCIILLKKEYTIYKTNIREYERMIQKKMILYKEKQTKIG